MFMTGPTTASTALEQSHRFYMQGMREHIHNPGGFQMETAPGQLARVPREGFGIAGHIDESAGSTCGNQGNGFERAAARRVEQNLRIRFRRPGRFGVPAVQVGGMETGIFEPVGAGVLFGPRHHFSAALDPCDPGATAGDRQAEIAEAAEQVEYPVFGFEREQFSDQAHRPPVHGGVDLQEVQRMESQTQTEFRQMVIQPLRTMARIKPMHAVDSRGLQVHLQAPSHGEFGQPMHVFGVQRPQMTHHEGRFRPKGVVESLARRDFDLRDRLARRQSVEQYAQWPDQFRQTGREHLAIVHDRDIVAAFFPKSHQDAALAAHHPHRQPRLAAVVPYRAGYRRQRPVGFRFDSRDFAQTPLQQRLLFAQLRTAFDILPAAAAADIEHRATRPYRIGSRSHVYASSLKTPVER